MRIQHHVELHLHLPNMARQTGNLLRSPDASKMDLFLPHFTDLKCEQSDSKGVL